jgi:hypothetical protein
MDPPRLSDYHTPPAFAGPRHCYDPGQCLTA